MKPTTYELILSNLQEIIRACPNTYAAYVAAITIEKVVESNEHQR